MSDDRRARGLEIMRQVYGWEIDEPSTDDPGDFLNLTVDHLFGTVWDRGDFTLRERRLLLVGLLVGLGLDDVAELQCDAALRVGDLSATDLRELVVFLAHYAGWPRGAKLNSAVETLIARYAGE
ncbi:MAG TPA: carboxymuconolactone decarboxylase family protein [Acidimicrobiia bacterium]|nr:carboxymuconolactone decarboxylase family protein [Acidimicrobiia bacterium]